MSKHQRAKKRASTGRRAPRRAKPSSSRRRSPEAKPYLLPGETRLPSYAALAREFGLSRALLSARLRRGVPLDQALHKPAGALIKHGEEAPTAVLTQKQVDRIRALHKKGLGRRRLSALYPNVSPSTIREILAGRTWADSGRSLPGSDFEETKP